ncbi:hypothetical protein ACGF5I_43075, partial [Streptomyces bobili]
APQELTQVRADLTALYKRLPYSVEPMEGWQRGMVSDLAVPTAETHLYLVVRPVKARHIVGVERFRPGGPVPAP